MPVYYLGFTLGAARVVRPGDVPANYTKPETIAKKQQELLEEAAAASPRVPTAGVVVDYCLIDGDGRVIDGVGDDPAFGSAPPPYPARALVETIGGLLTPGALLVGFDARVCLRVACMEVLRSNLTQPGVPVPQALHVGDNPQVVDPYTALVAHDARKHVPVEDLLAHLGVAAPPARIRSARGAAEIARALCLVAQLRQAPPRPGRGAPADSEIPAALQPRRGMAAE